MSNRPKKKVRNHILDEPMSKGKLTDIETLNVMKQAVIRVRKISKREIVENERKVRQF